MYAGQLTQARGCFSTERTSKSGLFGHGLSSWLRWAQLQSHEDCLLPNFCVLLKDNQHIGQPHLLFFPAMAWHKGASNRLKVQVCVAVKKPLLCFPSNLAYFISYKLFRTETDASCTHGLCLEVPLEFVITMGNRAFSNVALALSQEQ